MNTRSGEILRYNAEQKRKILEKMGVQCTEEQLWNSPMVDLIPHLPQYVAASEKMKQKINLFRDNITRLYTCPRCNGREATTEERHHRGGDEASRLQVTCLKCGHKWLK